MKPTFVIREAHARDHHFIVNSQIEMAYETENIRLDLPTVELGVGAVLLDSAKGKYYVAETEEGDLVGCLLTIPEWSDWRNGTVLWFHSLYVIPNMRKSGVFSALYAHLKKMIQADPGLRGLRLYVDRKNESAQMIYQKIGMSNEHYELFEWMKE